MSKVTVCVITKDEEANLARCLASVPFADEIVVVDCGSTDRTVAIAKARGARVLERDWPGFVAQKNRAVDAATHDLVLCLDADEEVSPALRHAIEAVRSREGPLAAAFAMAWETTFLGGPVRSDRGRARWKTRLFDRRRARWGGEEPHATVEVDGPVLRLDGPLLHHTFRDLDHHVRKMNAYTSAAAAAMAPGRRSVLFGVLVRSPWAFVRSFVLRGGFRDGARGFVVARLSALYVFTKYLKLYELRTAARRGTAGTPPRP